MKAGLRSKRNEAQTVRRRSSAKDKEEAYGIVKHVAKWKLITDSLETLQIKCRDGVFRLFKDCFLKKGEPPLYNVMALALMRRIDPDNARIPILEDACQARCVEWLGPKSNDKEQTPQVHFPFCDADGTPIIEAAYRIQKFLERGWVPTTKCKGSKARQRVFLEYGNALLAWDGNGPEPKLREKSESTQAWIRAKKKEKILAKKESRPVKQVLGTGSTTVCHVCKTKGCTQHKHVYYGSPYDNMNDKTWQYLTDLAASMVREKGLSIQQAVDYVTGTQAPELEDHDPDQPYSRIVAMDYSKMGFKG